MSTRTCCTTLDLAIDDDCCPVSYDESLGELFVVNGERRWSLDFCPFCSYWYNRQPIPEVFVQSEMTEAAAICRKVETLTDMHRLLGDDAKEVPPPQPVTRRFIYRKNWTTLQIVFNVYRDGQMSPGIVRRSE